MLEYSGAAAASAVIMSHSLKGKKIIFVEGTQEGLLLEGLFDDQLNAISAKGCFGVIDAVDTVNTYNAKTKEPDKIDIIGFIDKDYLHLRDEHGVLKRQDIVTTINRDIEIDIINSKAMKRFLEEKANPSKWGCELKVVEGVFDNLGNLSYLRAYNHLFEKKWDFKCIDLAKHTDHDGNINYSKLISTFRQTNHINAKSGKLLRIGRVRKRFSLKSITRGHDATCILGRMLQNEVG